MAAEMTVDMAEEVLVRGLQLGDMEAVEHALRFIASRDPKRASVLLNTMNTGLAILIEARSGE